jgi:hypothetical protein
VLPEFDDSALASKLSLHIGGAGVQDCLFTVLLDVGLPARCEMFSDSLDAGSVVVVQGTGSASEVGHSVVQPLRLYMASSILLINNEEKYYGVSANSKP